MSNDEPLWGWDGHIFICRACGHQQTFGPRVACAGCNPPVDPVADVMKSEAFEKAVEALYESEKGD